MITGEGQLDTQSLMGKGFAGLVAQTRQAGKPLLAVVGQYSGSLGEAHVTVAEVMTVAPSLDQAMAHAAFYITQVTAQLFRDWLATQPAAATIPPRLQEHKPD
ncbi:MAG: hypothetical protein OHK0012_15980 [Synechococcales cyanobacterium]